jgi:hypothetical protein
LFAVSSRWEEKVLDERRQSIEDDEREEKDTDFNYTDLVSECDFAMIGDLFEACKRTCGSRKLSVLIDLLLRLVDPQLERC